MLKYQGIGIGLASNCRKIQGLMGAVADTGYVMDIDAIAATGITLAGGDGSDEQALRAQAAAIARKLSTSIADAGTPLW